MHSNAIFISQRLCVEFSSEVCFLLISSSLFFNTYIEIKQREKQTIEKRTPIQTSPCAAIEKGGKET